MKKYDHKKVENKWRKYWEKEGIYKTQDNSKKLKCYTLDMFPYPSGEGLHVGHVKGYIATDIYSRFKRMNGFNMLHPMGWDAFGLPAENYAIKNKIHPKIATDKNIKRFKDQLEQIGFDYDWSREINTTDPEYYKWTQWIFLQMYKKGLAYESYEPINWCPSCKTGLANEDLDGDRCERCETKIEQKPMRQWVLRITDYADRLLSDLNELDWPDHIKESQRNWIGKSDGVEISFKVKSQKSKVDDTSEEKGSASRLYLKKTNDPTANPRGAEPFSSSVITVFTTRIDTIFGVTYLVVSPEHEIISNLKSQISNFAEVGNYVEKAKSRTSIERTAGGKNKTGVELKGVKAINPVSGEELSIWVADYVLPDYGTGAIMAVPAHDERDWEFAKKYNLPIRQVICSHYPSPTCPILEKAYMGDGHLVGSGEFSGMKSGEAKEKMTQWLEEKKMGKRKINYKLKDWVFSRQRYWGEPIPLVFCENCAIKIKSKISNLKNEYSEGEILNPGWIVDEDLPVELPRVKSYEPTGTGESPLAAIDKWVNTKCPKCGGKGKRETNTMPQWAGSSWYYLRYIDPKNKKSLIDEKKEKYWMGAGLPRHDFSGGVDVYVGGAEHATRHLIYARFWHKFLNDIGIVSGREPFAKLFNVGLIMAEDGRKMSKRWGNVINPDDIIKEWGADTLRMYEMFMGPFEQAIPWNTKNIIGAKRFLDKIWGMQKKFKIQNSKLQPKT